MRQDIIIIGGGASGLIAAYGAATAKSAAGTAASMVNSGPLRITVLEKMPRPARKIMITGKGRCNFTNVKDWNNFSSNIRTNPNFLKSAFFNLTPEKLLDFFEANGVESVVERGDRAYPASYKASDIVDALERAAKRHGVNIVTSCVVNDIVCDESAEGPLFTVAAADGRTFTAPEVIIATGGLSYPRTGSSGDGYGWAVKFGHSLKPCFPSLTALVPSGYKNTSDETMSVGRLAAKVLAGGEVDLHSDGHQTDTSTGTFLPDNYPKVKGYIPRTAGLTELGKALCGVSLKNMNVSVYVNGRLSRTEFGDLDFTDGGLEGPVGFTVSRDCVKSILNGSKVRLVLDLKGGIAEDALLSRVKSLWKEVYDDPRSVRYTSRDVLNVVLGKLMPRELVKGFILANPAMIEKRQDMGRRQKSRYGASQHVVLEKVAGALKNWILDIEGYVGYERCVVTAGGISTDEVVAKTMESKKCPGLYLCGEVLDIDANTGGYNLHLAFSTGLLAGQSAAKSLL